MNHLFLHFHLRIYKLCTLSKIRRYINEDVAIKLYKSLILSIIDNGNVFYDCAGKGNLDKIQKLQNRALRIVSLVPRYISNIELHKKFNVLPLHLRRARNLQKLMHNHLLQNINQIDFPWSSNEDNTRDSMLTKLRYAPYILLKIPKSTKYKDCCTFKGPQLWLSLPLCSRLEVDPNRFKLLLKSKAVEDLKTIISVLY